MNTFDIQTNIGALKLNAKANIQPETIVISGENGAGKTTLLRCLAGLQDCKGMIQVDGTLWLDSAAKFMLLTSERNIGFVWAESVLLPWLNVEENITLGITQHAAWLKEVCTAFEVDTLSKRKPNMLSTGEAQRVALARAIYRKPSLLLLDEPFSAQAPEIRKRLRIALKAMQKTLNIPMFIVSHDADDAKVLAQQHWHMRAGKLMAEVRNKPQEKVMNHE